MIAKDNKDHAWPVNLVAAVSRAGPVVLVGGAAALAPKSLGPQSYMYAVYYI